MDPRDTVGRIYKEDHLHCYTQNMEALGHVVSEKKIFYVFAIVSLCYCKSMGANDPRGGAILEPMGMVGRNYKEDYYTLPHTKYESSGPCGFGFYLSLRPRGVACMNHRGTAAGFIKRTTIYCYIENMKSSGPCGFGE